MVNVHSVQVVVAVVSNDDLVCMVCKCTAVCHVLLGYRIAGIFRGGGGGGGGGGGNFRGCSNFLPFVV